MGERRIVVVGRGVIGLTTALRLRRQGHDVRVVARDDLARSASMAAGAYWWPYKVQPRKKVMRWAGASLHEYRRLARNPRSGVRFHTHLRFCSAPEEAHACLAMLDDWEEIDGGRYGVDCAQAFRAELPLIEVPTYMPFLEESFRREGGRIEAREVESPEELFDVADVVVNCTGIGAGRFVGDAEVYPIRGQIVRVRPAEPLPGSVRFVVPGDNQVLVLPRSEDCILGGTAQEGDWSLEPDPATGERILANCSAVFPMLARSEIVGHAVGLRPGRREVRLQPNPRPDGKAIVHNYGHGGSGFTVSWGCADEAAELIAGL